MIFSLLLMLTADSDRLRGDWPSDNATIDVDLNGTVADALQQITKKAGWSLVVSSPALDQKITIRSAKRPVYEVLSLVLEAGELMARLEGKTLIVKAYAPKTDDELEREEEERERREDERQRKEEEEEDTGAPGMPMPPPLPPMAPLQGIVRDKESITAMGQDLTILKEEVVDDAVVSGGDLVVFGRIKGDAVAMGGDVVLKEGAVVEGDATAIGGKVHIEKGAILKGDKNDMGRPLGGLIKRFAKSAANAREHREHREHTEESDEDSGFGWVGFVAKLFGAVAAFVIGVMLMAFVPERVRRVKDILREKPIQSAAAGFATLLGFLPFCVLLAVTIVGIALVPLAVVTLVATYVLGYIGLGLWVGEAVWPRSVRDRRTPLAAMSSGLLVLTVLSLIPWAGTLAVFLLSTFATGAVLISRLGAPPEPSVDL